MLTTNLPHSPSFVMKPAGSHLNAGIPRHQMIGVLDPAIPLWVGQLLVAVVAYSIKFEQPMLKAAAPSSCPEFALESLARHR